MATDQREAGSTSLAPPTSPAVAASTPASEAAADPDIDDTPVPSSPSSSSADIDDDDLTSPDATTTPVISRPTADQQQQQTPQPPPTNSQPPRPVASSSPLDPASPSPPPSGAASPTPVDPLRRLPSLRAISVPTPGNQMSASSSLSGTLSNARRPRPSAVGLPSDIMQRARALHQQRLGMSPPPPKAAMSPHPPNGPPLVGAPSPGLNTGMPTNMRLPPGVASAASGRRFPPNFPHSSTAIVGSAPSAAAAAVAKKAPSLSERRQMKLGGARLGGLGPPGSVPSPSTPKLSDLCATPAVDGPTINGEGRGSSLNDFKNYIDAEKGWITFEGAATITKGGVNFANGQTFKISLDEIDVLDELGKGNYGTVYKVRHARPRVLRFGPGLSQRGAAFKQPLARMDANGSEGTSSSTPPRSDAISSLVDGTPATNPSSTSSATSSSTSGVIMAMKEIRLELEESKFTTILKELVILHECVSPYIIDFYGAFFQDGAAYMCVEYMDGGSIDKLYDGGIFESVLKKITYATIMGLKTLKDDHNIIHRDVKPTNILANTRGQVKICDFGVSGNLVASIAKTNIGCQSYMAPERISGGTFTAAGPGGGGAAGTYSVQSDIWSLGLTIIECAQGKYPYPPEVSSTIFSQLSAIVEGDPPNLPSDGYSAVAQDFVKSCLNKIPAQRHTYPMLLSHPWIKSLNQPSTISEDAAAKDELPNELAKMHVTAKNNITSTFSKGDAEVAAWVISALERKKSGGSAAAASAQGNKPALHAAPLTAAADAVAGGM